ncbi:MAG: DNA damage-inducible protein D [Chloroflexota bacterium]|nr:DNA damage-inducible protein D [Chloroflexota bacterium]
MESPSAPSPFEQIRQSAAAGDYWWGRDLAELLGYDEWRSFRRVVDRARIACANTGHPPADHFIDERRRNPATGTLQADVQLSRFACYLIIESADPRKPAVALGHGYFAIQVQRAEQADQAAMTEDQHRLFLRQRVSDHNRRLTATARTAGVLQPQDFAIFHDHRYRGLYGGLSARDLLTRRHLAADAAPLDYMGAEELAANLFTVTQTEAKLRRDGIQDKDAANAAARHVGQRVREFLLEDNGVAPEDLPTPLESIQAVQRAERRRIRRGPQHAMFVEPTDEP